MATVLTDLIPTERAPGQDWTRLNISFREGDQRRRIPLVMPPEEKEQLMWAASAAGISQAKLARMAVSELARSPQLNPDTARVTEPEVQAAELAMSLGMTYTQLFNQVDLGSHLFRIDLELLAQRYNLTMSRVVRWALLVYYQKG